MCLAIPGEVIDVFDEQGMRFGRVRFGGVEREVCLQYVPTVEPGEFVLVHVGFAIGAIDREAAARAWAVLEELGEVEGEGDEVPR
jgi:hydrogenase expression/formation protein HypC